ncbi:hypothetical protein [uncultured phage cr125_1]|uniref:Uncharacterized protein n=1 Tax=uncultured phage cr125_1 TaxID=2772091 RepID=A0A7M1RT15_9CAUD|nr:hypothetical protein KNV58_gp020 [uncultured phage cr125_1]QOR57533.1 hypothetical protein [uncultured phage cr125_1]
MQCLNLNNKEVKAAFDEVAQVIGEDAAYYVISENNGYAIDLGPDGSLSKVFTDILERNEGDREATIKQMAATFIPSKLKELEDYVNIELILGKDGDIYPAGVVLDKLKDNLPNNLIKDLFKDSDVLVKLDSSSKYYMVYKAEENCIIINPNTFNNLPIQYNAVSILHELVHAYSSRAIFLVEEGKGNKLEQDVYNRIEDIRKYYADAFSSKRDKSGSFKGVYYGLNDAHEFIAEFLTNQQFVYLLTGNLNQDNKLDLFVDKVKAFWNSVVNLILGKKDLEYLTVEELDQLRSELFDFISFNHDSIEHINDRFEREFLLSTELNGKEIEQMLNHLQLYNFNTKEELEERLKDIRKNLETGLTSRLNVIDEKDPAKKTELREQIKYQIKNLQNDLISDIEVIMSFTNELKDDIRVVAREVIDAYNGKTDALSNERLVSLNKNYFGFYCKYADEVYKSLVNLSEYSNIIGTKLYDKLLSDLLICKSILDACSDHVKRMLVQNAKNIMLKNGLLVGSPTIYNYLAENTKETNNDISSLTRLFGAGDKINDEAIKTLFNILQNTENTINSNTFNKAHYLLNKLKAAGNNQKILFEVDDDGKTTGYIVRERNYGKFQKDYKEFLLKTRLELGLHPGEITSPENRELRIQYNRKRNEWLSKHCERKYTKEYYDMFNALSDEASNARELIMIKIRDLTSKYKTIDGIVLYEKFTDSEWNQLLRLFLEKKLLSSKYDLMGNEKPEGSIERQIADELSELNDKIAKGLKMKTNLQKFEEVRKLKEKQLSNKDYNKWYERNTRTVYSEEFYDLLSKIDRSSYGEKYEELNRQKREILNTFRDDKTGEINTNLMPNSVMNIINRLDARMRTIRKSKKIDKSKHGLKFEDIAKIVPTEQYKRDYREALMKDEEVPGTLQDFELRHTYRDSLGRVHPKSYYTKIVPKDDKYVTVLPSMNFSEISEESPFYNKNFDRTNDEYYQPKQSLYDNSKAYKSIMKNEELKELRLAIIDTMEESNSKLDNLHGLNKYKLPQISGSWYKFLIAHNYNPFKATGNYLLDGVSVKGDDQGMLQKVKTAPDGTSLAMVPLYFIKDLDDPATISADMVGSVILYFKMAENFKLKSAIKGEVENIKAFLGQRRYSGSNTGIAGTMKKLFKLKREPKSGELTNIYQFAKKFIDMNVYDVKLNAITFSIGEREYNITKLFNNLRIYGTLRNLGLNFACAFTGFFTALHSHFVNALTGRYYDFSDAVYGFKDLIYDLFRYGINAGNKNYKSTLMALMDYFEVGSTIDSLFKNTNRNRYLNVLLNEWAFGVYSASDYFIKGQILNSVMYNYRNVNGEFISKEQYFAKYGRTENTKDEWNKYKSFKASIKFINNKLIAIDPKDLKAIDKVKFIIGNTARNLSASADGMLTSLLKALFSSNVFGAMCMMHRLYIPVIMLERWTMSKQWDYTSLRYVEGLLRTPLRVFSNIYKDNSGLSILTSTFNQLILNKGIEDELTRTNLKKLKIELTMILALWPFLAYITGLAADDDKRNKLLNLFAYVMARTSFESGAPYKLTDIYNTIKTPTPLYSLIDNFGVIASYPVEQFYGLFTDEKDKNKIITRGAYKGDTQLEKAIWQSTPLKNIIELNDIPSKRRYYDKQIANN